MMKMNWYVLIAIVATAFLSLHAVAKNKIKYMGKNMAKNNIVIFTAPHHPFSFHYAIPNTWEVTKQECDDVNCKIFFRQKDRHPTRKIFLSITVDPFLGLALIKKDGRVGIPTPGQKKNPHGVTYDLFSSPPSQYPFLQFYMKDFGVRVTHVSFRQSPISTEELFGSIVKTFRKDYRRTKQRI
ncbi:MAG: hypothetical protein A3I05_03940 [Deltaproteobacteria bacterium RIFCSPLOWO2_02_FULL_44_10]|nr:MAG: hypothetical protein A3C46_08045 [Deltaproteobacteria bacterium RIFCSPHIGHO2_02_FULL_44_16]OGQ47111.1 MAG: hypothetical protein A3I05_03940 [Deltaproteobacteria bacterium RIFCSPLOWO2_02_FULL_44_10]